MICTLLLLAVLLHAPVVYCQPLKLDEPVTYAHYYPDERVRPNSCQIAHRGNAADSLTGTSGYVPFIGTSVGRDSQQLILRLYYSTKDYPVKHFILVVPEKAMRPPHGAIWYQVEHLKQYASNVVIIACKRAPSVSEGWNAVFQAFPDLAWGVYSARDTAWMPGSLEKLAGHMWNASRDNTTELALMNWTWNIGLGVYNAFGMTRTALNRFGLFDENIYPAFYEDNDFQLRQKRMDPPMRVQVLNDVVLMHGKPGESSYKTSVFSEADPNDKPREEAMLTFVGQRADLSRAYVLRKWGCAGANWGSCAYKTPFNKPLPVWYWYTSKLQRALDSGLYVKGGQMLDSEGAVVYAIPQGENYSGWAGYQESAHMCRITGRAGLVERNSSGVWCV